MLSLYDNGIPGFTYRKAENIRDVGFCRIQIVAAGVITDWADFWTKSGTSSGSLARVLPIIGWDRELIRLQQESLPPYSFKLSEIKTILELMEKNGAARLDPWEIFV